MLFVGTREKYFIRLYQKQGVATWDELEGTAKNLTMAMDEGEPGPLAVVSAGPPQAGTRVPRRWSVLARCRLVPGSLGGGRCWPAAGWYLGTWDGYTQPCGSDGQLNRFVFILRKYINIHKIWFITSYIKVHILM